MPKSNRVEELNSGGDSSHRKDAEGAKRNERISLRPSALSAPSAVNFLLLSTLLLALALRLTDLTLQNIWWDEARNLDVALRPFWQIPTAPELDIQPPVYYWLLHGWLNLAGIQRGDAPQLVAYVARYFSVWWGVLGVALLYALTRRMASAPGRSVSQPAGSRTRLERGGIRTAALIAAAVGGFSPFWLAESQETRMYTLAFALLMGAALAWVEIGRLGDWEIGSGQTQKSPNRPISQSLFILFSAAALATHYNAVFILVAWYAGWGVWALTQPDRWRHLRRIVLTGLAMTILLLPLLPIALGQIPDYANPNLTVPTVIAYLVQNWTGFLAGYAWTPSPLGDTWLWAVLALLALSLQPLAASLHPNPQSPIPNPAIRHLPFAILWLLGGLALYYVAVVDRGAFNIRYSGFVTPALYALLGMGAAALGRWWKPLPLLAAAILLAGLLPAAQADLTDTRFFREDTAGLAAWLRASTGPGDVIFVDQKYPFGFYYERYAIDPSETPAGPELAPARYLFVDINTIDQGLTEWAGDAGRVFWVQWFESDTDPRGGVPFLLGKYGTPAGEETFQGYRLNWWELTPPTVFALADAFEDQAFGFRVPGISGQVWSEAVSLPSSPILAGPTIPVVIRWRSVAGDLDRPLKARVALYDEAGNRLAQDDRRLLNDRHLAPSQWAQADRPMNVYALPTAADLAPGGYDVRLLVYDAETLDPLELLDAAGNPAGQEVSVGRVTIGGAP